MIINVQKELINFYTSFLQKDFLSIRRYKSFTSYVHTIHISFGDKEIIAKDYIPYHPSKCLIFCKTNLYKYETTNLNKHLDYLKFLWDFENLLFNYNKLKKNN